MGLKTAWFAFPGNKIETSSTWQGCFVRADSVSNPRVSTKVLQKIHDRDARSFQARPGKTQ